ncbi:MAG TPA: glycoside hydrolase family 1 protein [Chloroflexi bacterium]|nr:glycoside hydrolase family 1 protein [Chloroflexota bacterium]
MPEATFHFPSDFKWGTATSSHQVEGENTNNDWWAWEQEEGRIKEGHRSGRACDWWQRAEEDFDRAAELGQNAHRLSVEWSRIEPREGYFDDAALDRYREILRGLRERDIEPMVTLHHFINPLWLAEMGGWENPRVVPLFERYVARVVEALGEFCTLWCTVNEPNVLAYLGYVLGVFPPGKQDFGAAMKVGRNLMRAHGAAYRRIHDLQPEAQVGFAHNIRVFDPANPRSPLDRWVARWQDRAYNETFLAAVTEGRWRLPLGFGFAWRLRNTLDWIGLNYYTRDVVAFDRRMGKQLFGRNFHPEDAELLDGGYGEFYPEGMGRSLRRLSRLGLPIYITENGIPDADDDQRPRYIVTHLHQVWRVIQGCVPIMGYFHWTLVDNFEWAEGWTLRFGLIELDPETQERRPRRSAYLYRDICKANAITPEIIDEYVPELRPVLLPG